MLPRHIAVIMDGNGRWAKQRKLPRLAGHKAGVDAVRKIIEFAAIKKIEVLTLFAFSSENWRRPVAEVTHLMELFMLALQKEAKQLHKNNIQLRVLGNREELNIKLQRQIEKVEILTANNTGLILIIASNYGGQWDITQACRRIAADVQSGNLELSDIRPELIEERLVTAGLPQPDLFIRTSGEQRISNFLIWQLAYAELYFTDVLWPDFDSAELNKALDYYSKRERRFGCTSEQLNSSFAV